VSTKKSAKGAARKGSLSRLGRKLKVGDRVRIVDISEELKDPNYDSRHPEVADMRTAELFRFCLGRVFTIHGFDRYEYAELTVDEDRAVRRKFGLNTIWIEPKFLERVRSSMSNEKTKRKTN